MGLNRFPLDVETTSTIEGKLKRFVIEAYDPTDRRARLNRQEMTTARIRRRWQNLVHMLACSQGIRWYRWHVQNMADELRVLARGLILESLIPYVTDDKRRAREGSLSPTVRRCGPPRRAVGPDALPRMRRRESEQEGISLLLIDMKAPGISVEVIVTIDCVHHTNQTFLHRACASQKSGRVGR